jgi:hypothetical protein
MPIKLSQIAAKTASITLWFGEDSLTIEYYPNLITDELILGWEEAQSRGEANTADYIQSNNEAFLSLIKSWDLLEDDDVTPIPLTKERMLTVPSVIKGHIMQTIMEEMRNPEVSKPRIKKR